ncbi:MAG: PQQ-binding-like beta-propeller repeat protein [Pseudonocardiaceae bacterium]|nr:PQQ-binding-like beta-propeller repeat protein [Pseudonocardiaceae bacterium]
MLTTRASRISTTVTAVLAATVLAGGGPATAAPDNAASAPIVVTYDGGLTVLDGKTLRPTGDVPVDGFTRINPAGDSRHLMVTTVDGFRVLDTSRKALTDAEFLGPKPGHVVHHADRTALFFDGSGKVEVFDPDELAGGMPETETYTSEAAHHGVAVPLENGGMVSSLGTTDERVGIVVLDENYQEILRSENCPAIHGEATAKDEAVLFGCEDGTLVYQDGKITKVPSPDAFGKIGTQSGSATSPIVLSDYFTDPDAEFERPEKVALTDTATDTMRIVDLGTSYSFRSLAPGPHDEALVLDTDGKIHVIDPKTGQIVNRIAATSPWVEPEDWQKPRPTIFARGRTAYVTEPATNQLHAIDLKTGQKRTTVELPHTPNELNGVPS